MLNKFKLFGVVAFLATAMLMCSCSKESQIVGKWKITKASSQVDDFFVYDEGETWSFKDDGDCTIFLGGVELDGDWSVSGDELTIILERYNTAKASGKFTIDEVSSTTMSLSGKWTIKFYDGESVGSYDYPVNYEFKKK